MTQSSKLELGRGECKCKQFLWKQCESYNSNSLKKESTEEYFPSSDDNNKTQPRNKYILSSEAIALILQEIVFLHFDFQFSNINVSCLRRQRDVWHMRRYLYSHVFIFLFMKSWGKYLLSSVICSIWGIDTSPCDWLSEILTRPLKMAPNYANVHLGFLVPLATIGKDLPSRVSSGSYV